MTTKKTKNMDNLLSQNKIQFFYPYPSARSANDPKYNFMQIKFEKKNSQSTLNNLVIDDSSPSKQEKKLNNKNMQFYQFCSNSNLIKQENTLKQEQSQRQISPKTQREQNNLVQQHKCQSSKKRKESELSKILTTNDLQTKLNQYFKVYQQLMNNSQQKSEKDLKYKKARIQLTINPQDIEKSYNGKLDRPLSSKNQYNSELISNKNHQKQCICKKDCSQTVLCRQKSKKSVLNNSKSKHLLSPYSNNQLEPKQSNLKTLKSQYNDSKKSTLTSTTPRQNQILAMSQSHQFLDLSSPLLIEKQQSGQKTQKIVRNNHCINQSQLIQNNPKKIDNSQLFKNQLITKCPTDFLQVDSKRNEKTNNRFIQNKSLSCKNSTKKQIDFSTRDSSKCLEGFSIIMQRTKCLFDKFKQKERVWFEEKQVLVNEIKRLNQLINDQN